MLNYIIDNIKEEILFGEQIANLFSYISFRSALAVILSLIITTYFGKSIISFLKRKSVGENIRKLGLNGEQNKEGIPTMGGVIILLGILLPTFLLCELNNIYVIVMILTSLWMGIIGFLDDYIKVFKKQKKGLAGKFKLFGQVFLGCLVSIIFYFHSDVTVQEKKFSEKNYSSLIKYDTQNEFIINEIFEDEKKSTNTSIPFFKNNQFDYSSVLHFFGIDKKWSWLVYLLIVVFIISAVSNGSNLTDGIDGLATGTSAIIGTSLAVFAYVSSNAVTANYLNIMFIPNSSELVVFMSAFVGSCVGFLWYNSYPAQVFMGDTGSLSLGAIIAVCAIAIRKELLIPIFCGVFFIESLSVIIQVSYFKYTKRKFGKGRRVFLMSPLHHHFQKKGIHESKISTRFWIVCVFLVIIAFVTLKVR
tara:strand:+ start:5004 stop:6257 length:1254 start_codon:yes stop_codon:yes gene_type:complete